MPVENQVVILYAATKGYLDDIEIKRVKEFENEFHKYLRASRKDVLEGILKGKELTEDIEAKIKSAIEEFKKLFLSPKS